jgi:hypothetical protein
LSYELRDIMYELLAKIWDIRSRLRRRITVRYSTWAVEWLYGAECRIVSYIDWYQLSRLIFAGWRLYGIRISIP